MILINLLPHREEKRKYRKQVFFVGLGVAAAVGVLIAGAWMMVLTELTSQQRGRNDFLSVEIKKLEDQIHDIASLKAEIESLKARQKVVIDFQIDRNMPVHLLNELAIQTPEGVYLSSLRQDGQKIVVTGVAQTNERVSELLRNIANNSIWLERPELAETKASLVVTSTREQKRLYDFSMKFDLKRPLEKPKSAVPAVSAPSASSARPS
ncbi:MAG: PilN domain-containing protein [Leptothrix ochracea]|uniref:PilN domain-containing protein n=1 Tax=Leptothrix ochracea TaxID=735331 RepID=UPI0034E1D30A